MDILQTIAVAVLGMALGASCGLNFVHYMHMFQLNSYHSDEQFKWIGKNKRGHTASYIYFGLGAYIPDMRRDEGIYLLYCGGFSVP